MTITCVADAFPAPNYIIFHNGMKLVVNGVKTIQSANLSNDGRYECVANNSIGNVRATFNLTVNGKFCVKTRVVVGSCPGTRVLPARVGFFRGKTRVPGFLGKKTGFLPKIVFFLCLQFFFNRILIVVVLV